ncbi:hypothetical protein HYPGJ_30812 [Hyphomicrobium sp. GJ21]|nr:hypothetical protein HYPGJ_30812 [Hyphomicrobium sp. GJ21]
MRRLDGAAAYLSPAIGGRVVQGYACADLRHRLELRGISVREAVTRVQVRNTFEIQPVFAHRTAFQMPRTALAALGIFWGVVATWCPINSVCRSGRMGSLFPIRRLNHSEARKTELKPIRPENKWHSLRICHKFCASVRCRGTLIR